jgi:RNA polymerase sigma factor (sigma-70 family)
MGLEQEDTMLQRAAPTTTSASDWVAIYARLRHDPNDEEAFAALARRVVRWAARELTSPAERAEREDVVADTCAAVVLGLDRAHGAATFAGFVYGHYLNARRQALRECQRPVEPYGTHDPPAPVAEGPSPDECALLARCLGALPRRERRAVELRYFAEATTAEIAAALDVSEANARRIVFNGLARLRHSAQGAWPAGRG